MSKRKTIDAFFKKKDVSNSEIRTPVAIETNVDTSMPDEHPSKCSRIQFEKINRDPGSRKQICESPINKQDEIRRAYLKECLYQPKNIDYPYNNDTHHHRFQPSWFELHSHRDWLKYSPSMDAIYCLPCYLFSKKPICRLGSDAFKVNDGMNCPLLRHMGKDPNFPHKIAVKCCEDLKNYSRYIDKLIEKQMSKELENNQLRLKTSIESSVVLENAPRNAKYTSPTIQKEILHILASNVRNAIREEIGDAKFCILVDEARDKLKREQMDIILRFVDKNGFIKERFFHVVHVRDTTVLTLKKEICAVLSLYNLHIENIRGQGLQLALVTVSREVKVVHQFFDHLTNIINLAVGSSKRNDELQYA
ncbi:uncharacterized protein LOC142644512 [Castanea sativa]|uniref:uncharacterized protein LOC142644512 n=1 Tax=Castanea sativa TaxID=21020 RepID=UPI003F652DF2